MTNNDILRRLRFTFDFNDDKMMSLWTLAEGNATRAQISDWMKQEDDPQYVNLPDKQLAIFLNGLINEKRGKREGEQPKPEKKLNNNIILRKLKIALSFKDEDIVAILGLADLKVSKHEVNAFFRKPGQRQYRECLDQFLRNFLQGLQMKYRKDI